MRTAHCQERPFWLVRIGRTTQVNDFARWWQAFMHQLQADNVQRFAWTQGYPIDHSVLLRPEEAVKHSPARGLSSPQRVFVMLQAFAVGLALEQRVVGYPQE